MWQSTKASGSRSTLLSALMGGGIHSLTISKEGFNIHLFLDADLLVQEITDITKRTEKKNSAMELKRKGK